MRSTRKRKSQKKFPVLMLSIFIIILLVVGGFFMNEYIQSDQGADSVDPAPEENPVSENNQENTNERDPEPEPEPEPEPDTFTNIRIAATGDIMFHGAQITSGYNAQNGTYNFESVFADVKPIFEAADLAIANYETTTAGPSREYSGFPLFSAPDETIDAIKYAGIDVLTTANNHSLDTGIPGLKRTVEVIRERGISSVGTYDEAPESRVLMKDVEGVKVAILSYTESTNGLGGQYPAEELNAMLNIMNEDTIMKDIQEAKELEADLIITYMHWGVEYAENPSDMQVELAQKMAAEGVDIILGSHPHVIQRSEFIEVDDHKAFVIYSMGNFVSNQRKETLVSENELTEDGVIVNFDIRKNDRTKETTIESVEYVPTWVYRNIEQGQSKHTYRILPIDEFLNSPDISEAFKARMERSKAATVSKMEAGSSEES